MSDGEINVDSIDGEVSTSANIVGQLYPQGEKGDKGDPGNDGFSPTVTTEKVGKTTTITITDAEGEHTATILDGADGQGSGDMRTEVYDVNQNGIVDNAEKVNNHTVGTDVPADAVFTDTTYTAGTGIDITGNVITNTQTSAEWGNITGTLSDQTDLKNALDDKADASDIPTKVSDLTNDSGFIDKDVNDLTNYDTSTTVNTKISDAEEVLIGGDTGIKAGHQLWVDTNDATPYINSEISNDYGTAQNLGYSQEYVNDKLDKKLDADATAVNSTKWNNLERDTTTVNDADTWIPVLNGEKMQHTTVASINSRGVDNAYSTSQAKSYSSNYSNTNFLSSTFNEVSITTNNNYVNATGYFYCYKNSKLCMFNGNFRINTVPPKDAILCSGLPVPKLGRVTFIGITDTTAVRLYINDSGNLCADSTNFTTGWVNCAIMYLLP